MKNFLKNSILIIFLTCILCMPNTSCSKLSKNTNLNWQDINLKNNRDAETIKKYLDNKYKTRNKVHRDPGLGIFITMDDYYKESSYVDKLAHSKEERLKVVNEFVKEELDLLYLPDFKTFKQKYHLKYNEKSFDMKRAVISFEKKINKEYSHIPVINFEFYEDRLVKVYIYIFDYSSIFKENAKWQDIDIKNNRDEKTIKVYLDSKYKTRNEVFRDPSSGLYVSISGSYKENSFVEKLVHTENERLDVAKGFIKNELDLLYLPNFKTFEREFYVKEHVVSSEGKRVHLSYERKKGSYKYRFYNTIFSFYEGKLVRVSFRTFEYPFGFQEKVIGKGEGLTIAQVKEKAADFIVQRGENLNDGDIDEKTINDKNAFRLHPESFYFHVKKNKISKKQLAGDLYTQLEPVIMPSSNQYIKTLLVTKWFGIWLNPLTGKVTGDRVADNRTRFLNNK